MRIMPMALGALLVTSLSAEEPEPGFKFAGIRGGIVSFDPQDDLEAASFLGLQGGLVFDQQRYGLSFEGFVSHPKRKSAPGATLDYSQFSATLMAGLGSAPGSRFWPYCGLGLGSMTVPKVDPSAGGTATTSAAAAHLSFGLLHRPFGTFIWGIEGRWVFAYDSNHRENYEGALMAGFSWGGAKPARAAAVSPPPVAAEAPAPAAAMAPPAPPPPVVVPPVVAPEPAAPVPAPPPPVPAPAALASPSPAAAAAPPVITVVVAAPPLAQSSAAGTDLAGRLDALRREDMPKALELGRKRIEATPGHHWTIRLEIANLPSTLKNAVGAFPGQEPDLFIAPITFKGGKTSYQLFLGTYATKAEAERAARSVPAFFLEGGQKPKPFQLSGIPAQGSR